MHHPTTLHEIARLERADALRRVERAGPESAGPEGEDSVERVGLRSRIAARLDRAARGRVASLPETPAA